MQPGLDKSWSWKSWVSSANEPGSGFPLQNLPYCVFAEGESEPHIGVGIGRLVLDLNGCVRAGLLDALPGPVRASLRAQNLNPLMACGREAASRLRRELMRLLSMDAPRELWVQLERLLVRMAAVTFHKPIAVANYTDFYASIDHAANVGRLFRPQDPLLPNYKYVPIGYHGRASSLLISGAPIARPNGQFKPSADGPIFGPTQQLDYELEVGAYVATGNVLGEPIPIANAESHLFGISLVNDWSARDIQVWESQPLGPFLGKSFATSVSPWVVSFEALAPFRVPAATRPDGDPAPLPYLAQPLTDRPGIDLQVEVHLSTPAMRAASLPPARLSHGNLAGMYWTFAQMVAHHTSNGCNLLPGDLLASGTVSGPEQGSEGCLLELTRRGSVPLSLPNGESRAFLEDGDEVILSGFCRREGLPRISLGECRGVLAPTLV